MEQNCHYHRLLPEEEPLKELKSMLSNTFKNKQVSMWGIPINTESLNTTETAKSDVILLKFLEAKKFRVKDTYNMFIKCLEWRKAYGADSIVKKDLGFRELENSVSYNMGRDREGRSICYTNYSDFFKVVGPWDNRYYVLTSLYKEIFNICENKEKFIRWRIQVIERVIRKLSFTPGGVNSSIVLVQDYKHLGHKFSRNLMDVDKKICSILRDNYPGMISYKIHLNVPWISRATCRLDESMMCKLVISSAASDLKTLHKYISPENIPQLYGSFCQTDNLKTVPVSKIMLKGGEKFTIKIEDVKAHAEVLWDVVAGGSHFEYSCKFVPDEESSLVKMLQNPVKEKLGVCHFYTAEEPGKIVISIHNKALRKTKLVSYRYKVQN